MLVSLKLGLTLGRYYSLKHSHKENIPLFLGDLIVMNLLFAYLFIKANLLYFSGNNNCAESSDVKTKWMYTLFLALMGLGYLQMVQCIVLGFMLPFLICILHKFVEHRLSISPADQNLIRSGLMGGLL